MAAIKLYVPIYMDGEPTRGKDNKGQRTKESKVRKAYQFAVVNATITTDQVPEGQPCISGRVMTVTPPASFQPPEAA